MLPHAHPRASSGQSTESVQHRGHARQGACSTRAACQAPLVLPRPLRGKRQDRSAPRGAAAACLHPMGCTGGIWNIKVSMNGCLHACRRLGLNPGLVGPLPPAWTAGSGFRRLRELWVCPPLRPPLPALTLRACWQHVALLLPPAIVPPAGPARLTGTFISVGNTRPALQPLVRRIAGIPAYLPACLPSPTDCYLPAATVIWLRRAFQGSCPTS